MNEWEWRLLEAHPVIDRITIGGVLVGRGSRVRLRPRAGGDAQDMLLDGKTATINSIEQDYDGVLHLAVVIDDDPGRDLGLSRQPAHRFFFSPDDVEPLGAGAETEAEADGGADARLAPSRAPRPSILVAGIGNIFLGDDGFGVEVVKRVAGRALPDGVRVEDFGIRGLDLAYALSDTEAANVTILIDACPCGHAPGTLYLIEPELDLTIPSQAIEPHGMEPVAVLRLARGMGGTSSRVLLLGCEPATLGPPEGQLGLSESVDKAADTAVELLLTVVRDIQNGRWPAEGRA